METATVDATDWAEDRLRQIRSLTGRELAYLEIDELLDELLDRARSTLDADTAAVLLLRNGGSELVATLAQGLEEEVHQNVRIPLGRGFAGRIAAEGRPVILERVDHSTVLNPLLRRKGIRSLLGVPLLLDGKVFGVLHVGTLRSRRFTGEDAELLQLAADRIALALGARRVASERTASIVLQSSLVPVDLPRIPGLEMAGRYVAGEEGGVGGDWYDVFTLPTGHVCVVVGDVVGRGFRAAVVMGRLRTAVQAYALDHVDPAEIVTRVDRKLRHFEPWEMATMLLAVVDPSLATMRLSLAGHPPPVLAEATAPVRFVDLPVDPPLGVRDGTVRHSTTLDLTPGATVCFYTDGLVERRTVPLDDRLEALRAVVTADAPDVVCTTVMGHLVEAESPADDIALLVLRRRDHRDFDELHMVLPAESASLSGIRAGVRRWLATAGATPDDVTDLLVAVGEACTNVIEHAYGPDPGCIDLRMTREAGPAVEAVVRDTGSWRPPRGRNRGRGLSLIEGLCDEVQVDTGTDGTEVVMHRRIGGASGTDSS